MFDCIMLTYIYLIQKIHYEIYNQIYIAKQFKYKEKTLTILLISKQINVPSCV